MARRLLSTATPLLTRRVPAPALSALHQPRRSFALNSSSAHTSAQGTTGQSPAGGANNQAAGHNTGINANQQAQRQTSAHSTQPANEADVTKRPATSSPTGGAGLGVGEKDMTSGSVGSFAAQADKQGKQQADGAIGQGMGDKHSKEVHKDRATSGVVPGTGNATSGDATVGGTGNAGSLDGGSPVDKASTGSKGANAGGKAPQSGGSGSGKRGFATKAAGGHASNGAASSNGNTNLTSGIGSAPTTASKNSNNPIGGSGSSSGGNNHSSGTTSGSSASGSKTSNNSGSNSNSNSHSSSNSGSGHNSSSSNNSNSGHNSGSSGSSGSGSGQAKSNLGTASSSGASTVNSVNAPGLGGAGSAGSSTSGKSSGSGSGSSSSATGSKSGGSTTDPTNDHTTVESNSGKAGGVGSTGSPRAGSSAGGGAAPANTGEHSPGGTAGGVGTGSTTTMADVKEKVRDFTGDVQANIPAASSYTVIAAVLLGVPLLFVLDPDRAYLKKQHVERGKELEAEYH